jgi:hypothetical protein
MLEGPKQDPLPTADPPVRPAADGGHASSSLPTSALWWTARCVACGAPSTTQPHDAVPGPAEDSTQVGLPAEMPSLELCDDHWTQYETDWFILGWCVDHYGEALRYCQQHGRTIEPL